MNRKQIIKEHIEQEDFFRVLRLALQKMMWKEHHHIQKLGLKRPVNAGTLDSLALEMEFLHRNFRLVKK